MTSKFAIYDTYCGRFHEKRQVFHSQIPVNRFHELPGQEVKYRVKFYLHVEGGLCKRYKRGPVLAAQVQGLWRACAWRELALLAGGRFGN